MNDNYYFGMKKPVSAEALVKTSALPKFIRTKETGDKVFFIKDGEYHWITSPEILSALGGDFGKVVMISRGEFQLLQSGGKITKDNLSEFTVGEGGQNDLGKVQLTEEATDRPVKQVELNDKLEEEIAEKGAFKTYEEQDSFTQPETVKGMTSIIIPAYFVHYPAFHFTGNCIGSIREHTNKKATPYEIILVVNGNNSAIQKMDEALMKNTYADKIIVNEENLGFAKAVNQGIRAAKGEYIAIVNNDVQVFDNWLPLLTECLIELDLVMATPMYGLPFARAVEANGITYKYLSLKHTRDERLDLIDSFSDFVDFSCVLTRKALFEEIGTFNENFFMYGEDLDLLRRMRREGKTYASTKLVNTTHIIGSTATAIDGMSEIMNQSKAKLKEIWGE